MSDRVLHSRSYLGSLTLRDINNLLLYRAMRLTHTHTHTHTRYYLGERWVEGLGGEGRYLPRTIRVESFARVFFRLVFFRENIRRMAFEGTKPRAKPYKVAAGQ